MKVVLYMMRQRANMKSMLIFKKGIECNKGIIGGIIYEHFKNACKFS